MSKGKYSHISGTWHEYHITRDVSRSADPIWAQKRYVLDIKESFVQGTSENVDYPQTKLTYDIRGEIKQGHMIITEYCLQDESEFLTSIYPNLLSSERLVGIWDGFDFDRNPFAGPSILSRSKLEEDELNQIVAAHDFDICPSIKE